MKSSSFCPSCSLESRELCIAHLWKRMRAGLRWGDKGSVGEDGKRLTFDGESASSLRWDTVRKPGAAGLMVFSLIHGFPHPFVLQHTPHYQHFNFLPFINILSCLWLQIQMTLVPLSPNTKHYPLKKKKKSKSKSHKYQSWGKKKKKNTLKNKNKKHCFSLLSDTTQSLQ